MTIGVDIRTLMDARYSGISEHTLNLVKEIFKLDNLNEYRLFYNSFGDCPNIPNFANEKVKLIKYNYPNKILNYCLFKLFNYPKIDKELAVDKFFMPHINFIGLSAGVKSLIIIYDLSFLINPEFFSWRMNLWHRLVNIKKLIKRFDVIVAVSENTKQDIIDLLGINQDKIKVIYPGLNTEFVNIKLSGPKINEVKIKYNLPDKYILYLGTVEPRKNVDGLIVAYNEFRRNYHGFSNIKLVIAGAKGWKSRKVYCEWKKSEFKKDILFLGYIDWQDKAYLYNLADVFVYPSFYEGFGFPPLEAMASGTPVITSFASSLPEVVGDAALIIDPYKIEELTLSLNKIFTSSPLRDDLIKKGLERVKQFSWEKSAKAYLKILNGSNT
jgi:glycosyltransferase involved in cell wall biosynthesis